LHAELVITTKLSPTSAKRAGAAEPASPQVIIETILLYARLIGDVGGGADSGRDFCGPMTMKNEEVWVLERERLTSETRGRSDAATQNVLVAGVVLIEGQMRGLMKRLS